MTMDPTAYAGGIAAALQLLAQMYHDYQQQHADQVRALADVLAEIQTNAGAIIAAADEEMAKAATPRPMPKP
jgi:hypothetical protein